MSTYKKIVPNAVIGQEYEEGRLVAETLPGTLVGITHDASGIGINALKLTKNAVRGRNAFIVLEDPFFGKTVADAITIDSRARVMALPVMCRFTGIVKSGVAIAVDDFLVPDVAGLVDKATTTEDGSADTAPASALYQAMEACTAGATGDARRILLRVIR